MKITSLSIENIRSFTSINIQLSSSINLFVGANNNGKSTLLTSIHLLQGNYFNGTDIRLGEKYGRLCLAFQTDHLHKIISSYSFDTSMFDPARHDSFRNEIIFNLESNGNIASYIPRINSSSYSNGTFQNFPLEEPKNLIYPFLSKRKVVNYSENMNL